MSPRRKRLLSRLLAALAAFGLLVAATAVYSESTLFNSKKFSSRAVSVLDDEAVQAQLATGITNGVISANPDLIAARPVIEGVSGFIVGLPPLQTILQAGINDVHRSVIEGDQDTFLVTLADIGTIVSSALETVAPKLADQVPVNLDIALIDEDDVDGEGLLIDLSQIAKELTIVEWLGLLLALAAAAGSVALAPTRFAGMRRLGRAIAVGGFVAVIGWQIGRGALAAQFDGPAADTARAFYTAMLGDLRTWFLVITGGGIVLTAGASSTREPVDVRAATEHAWALITRVPERPALRVVRALGLIVAGIVIVSNRESVLELAAFALGAYVIYVGAAELMRMAAGAVETAEADPEAAARLEAEADLGIGALARIGAVGVLLFGLVVFAGFLNDEDESPALAVTTCNGYEALCDRTLDEVAFAGSHNSMSGATYDDWFFAQHEKGITQQLESGIRALLLDPHYGVQTSGGVATDLEKDATSGPKVEMSLGPEGVAAAENIRNTIGYTGGGETEVFLCHAFCEVGAIKAADGFAEIRDFLVRNPGEVLVLSIEDATTPEDTIAAIEEGGLLPFVYDGPNGPWPTLQEMIDSNQRVLVMAEREGGEPAWYRDQFEITKETPFSFDEPEQLAKKSSCEPNRGDEDAPFFLINHWVDTSPAPKPTNAKVVNAPEFLLDRLELCEEVRGMRPGIVAVDFFGTGDVVAVVDELNGVSPPPDGVPGRN